MNCFLEQIIEVFSFAFSLIFEGGEILEFPSLENCTKSEN